MVDWWPNAGIFAATIAAVVIPFAVVPEILERLGYDPRSGAVRALVWASFLAIVMIPAAAVGFLFSVTNVVDWLIFLVAMAVAILYDYYRLNPTKIPWARPRT
ncbi:MAG: hypothetical protein L3J78_00190 [Thermoplasmata archaeon]|nr:hypothetical protein [Thermoplasmata archaeon]